MTQQQPGWTSRLFDGQLLGVLINIRTTRLVILPRKPSGESGGQQVDGNREQQLQQNKVQPDQKDNDDGDGDPATIFESLANEQLRGMPAHLEIHVSTCPSAGKQPLCDRQPLVELPSKSSSRREEIDGEQQRSCADES